MELVWTARSEAQGDGEEVFGKVELIIINSTNE